MQPVTPRTTRGLSDAVCHAYQYRTSARAVTPSRSGSRADSGTNTYTRGSTRSRADDGKDASMEQRAPYGREVRIRIGGPAGFGIKAAGATLARVFARAGYHTFDLTEYPSLIKGGHNTYHLRVSEDEIFSHVMPTDILVALDAATIPLHLDELTDGGAIVFDPQRHRRRRRSTLGDRADDVCLVPVPLTEIVRDVGGMRIMRNVAALGAVLGHMEFPLDGLLDSLRAPVRAQGARDRRAERRGRHARATSTPARRTATSRTSSRRSRARQPRVLADGNEATRPRRARGRARLLRRLPDDARRRRCCTSWPRTPRRKASSSSTPRTRSPR